jgi:acyl carrier protein
MSGAIEYARALFDRATVDRFAGHYLRLLEAIVADPGRPLSTVQFLTPSERDQLLTGWGEPGSAPTTHQVSEIVAASAGGRPLDGARVYLLDRQGSLAPIGVPGEICVGGRGVANGAMSCPRLTAEQFVPDPFGLPGGRLFRSGELGRRRPDGSLDMLGRVDDRVTIRGCLVDPRRVAAVLVTHPSVRAAAVVAYQSELAGTRLRAFWTAHTGPSTAGTPVAEMVAHCGARLPDYQVPSEFVRVDRIPLTDRGEPDRAALVTLDGEVGPGPALAAPRNAAERAVAEIWAELLEVPVDVNVSFFGLGGNSILAIQMISKLRERFGVDVSVRRLFEQPTVARLAEEIETLVRAELAGLSDTEVLTESMLTNGQT